MTDDLKSKQYERPEIGPGVTLGRLEVETLRKLLHVAEAAAVAVESWPTHQCDTPDRDWDWPTDIANYELRLAAQHVSRAMTAITIGAEVSHA